MEKITSFTIDHNKLQPGVYVSRKDQVEGGMVTTFDLRMTSPNEEPVMNTAEMHTIEHLGATFLRNHGRIETDSFCIVERVRTGGRGEMFGSKKLGK